MKNKSDFRDAFMAFCVCTTCITLLEGTMGILFYPDELLDYKAFFAPPVFAVFSVILGLLTRTDKELTVRAVICRRVIHLLLIEGMVFGLNYLGGAVFPPMVSAVLVVGIALVFVTVYVILWLVDKNSAMEFNRKLKEFQAAGKATYTQTQAVK